MSDAESHFSLARPAGCLAYSLRRATQQPARGLLLLIHGLASNRSRYAEFAELTTLRQHWDIARIDLRGHGESELRGAVSLELWIDDIVALLDALGASRVVVVGHSLGAQLALALAAARPQRIAGLVLIDPLPRSALNARARRWLHALPLVRAAAAVVRGLNALGLRRQALPLRDLRAEDEAARALMAAGRPLDDFVRDYASTRADLRYFRTAHYLEEMTQLLRAAPSPQDIAMPVLVLLSAEGTFAEPDAVRAWAHGFARAQLASIDCHHWPLTERPAEIRAAIEAWVDALG